MTKLMNKIIHHLLVPVCRFDGSMKRYCNTATYMLIAVFILLISFSTSVWGRKENKGKEQNTSQNLDQKLEGKNKESNTSIPRMFLYKPPLRGKPGNRVGGGTRGQGNVCPMLAALVPNHTGLTTQAQPSLFWFLSESTTKKVEFTLSTKNGIKPLLEISLNINDKQGIQCIHLSDHGLRLLPGEEYQWFVALIFDPHSRSKDIVAGGSIMRIEPSKTLAEKLTKAEKEEIPGIYAGEGIWYDALSSVSELIKSNSSDKNLREKRSLLLEQVGLSEVADYERKGE